MLKLLSEYEVYEPAVDKRGRIQLWVHKLLIFFINYETKMQLFLTTGLHGFVMYRNTFYEICVKEHYGSATCVLLYNLVCQSNGN